MAEERVNGVMGFRSAEISISLEMLCSRVTFCNQPKVGPLHEGTVRLIVPGMFRVGLKGCKSDLSRARITPDVFQPPMGG